MIPMENIRKLSDSYRNIQEAEVDVNKMIKDLGGDFSGSNEDQMRGVQLLKGLALSDDPKANEFMEKLDKATSQISKEMSEGYGYTDNPHKKKKKVKEEIETVEESKSIIDLLIILRMAVRLKIQILLKRMLMVFWISMRILLTKLDKKNLIRCRSLKSNRQ